METRHQHPFYERAYGTFLEVLYNGIANHVVEIAPLIGGILTTRALSQRVIGSALKFRVMQS